MRWHGRKKMEGQEEGLRFVLKLINMSYKLIKDTHKLIEDVHKLLKMVKDVHKLVKKCP